MKEIVLAALIGPAVALGGPARGASLCPGLMTEHPEALRLGRILGADRLRLLMAAPADCLSREHGCQSNAYVEPGDQVIVSDVDELSEGAIASEPSEGGYLCVETATYPGPKINRGWVPADRVQIVRPKEPGLGWWAGEWKFYDDTISISVKGDTLAAHGDAIWRPSNPHFGGFEAAAKPEAGQVLFVDAEAGAGEDIPCRVRLIPLGDRIAVADNGRCGALNVRFSGVYSRSR